MCNDKGAVVELDTATSEAPNRLVPPAYVQALTVEERRRAERKLVRKIDLRLLPPIIVMYLLNYIDRNNIAAARLGGLEEDLNLHGTQYQTCVSILFVGYILMQVPSNLLLTKIGKPSIYLPCAMMLWGLVSTVTCAVQNFGGLLTVRFFLGFVEAPYFPGCLFFLSAWYTKRELALRTAVLYCGSMISGAFSGLIAAGVVGGMDGARGWRAWRWLFLIEGVVTIFIAFLCIPILPDFPRTTKWLSDDERELAIWRLKEEVGQDDWVSRGEQHLWAGFKLACKDIKVWLTMIILFCNIFSASVTNFFPTVVGSLGYGHVATLLLTAPPYMLGVICALANAWHADRTGERYWHVTAPLYVAVAAFIIAATTTTTAPRYLSMMLMIPGLYTGFVVALGWISNLVPRPPAKRAAAMAMITAVGNTSSIYASYMYQSSMGPRYVLAMSLCSASAFVAVATATVLRSVLIRLNKTLAEGGVVDGGISSVEVEAEGRGKGDGFRYQI